jgi:hypothetical protein
MSSWLSVCHFYSWTLDYLRTLTVEEWDAAVDTMNRIKRQEAGGKGRGAGGNQRGSGKAAGRR